MYFSIFFYHFFMLLKCANISITDPFPHSLTSSLTHLIANNTLHSHLHLQDYAASSKLLDLFLIMLEIFFSKMEPALGKGVKQAGHLGSRLGDCTAMYRCFKKPVHYRHPGHSFHNITGGLLGAAEVNVREYNDLFWKVCLPLLYILSIMYMHSNCNIDQKNCYVCV